MPRGGKRAGAGRKKKLTTLIRERAIEEAGEDAEYALGLLVAFARDGELDVALRRDCANDIMDRVWGKPTQRQELTGDAGGPLHIIETIICAGDTDGTADASAEPIPPQH
jgi:hypothetical protein